MPYELIIEEESTNISDFTDNQLEEVIDIIQNKWSVYNEGRQEQLDDIKVLRELIYSKYPSVIKYGERFTLPDLYEMQETFISHLSERVYYSNDSLFDIRGLDSKSIKTKESQKMAIVYDLDNMDFQSIINKCMINLTTAGELIALPYYKKSIKKRKVRKTDLKPIIQGQAQPEIINKMLEQFPAMNQLLVDNQLIEGWEATNGDILTSENITKVTSSHIYYDVVIYNGVSAIAIDSEDFVFDVQKVDDFDNADKIYRTYQSVDSILNNKNYNLTDKQIEFFTDKLTNTQSSSDLSQTDEKYDLSGSMDEIGDKLQVFDYWGDIILSDKTILKNYIITICMGEILRIEPNPYLINPFVYCCLKTEPNYRRGISPLRVAIIFNAIRSNIINAITDASNLIINPPYWAVKGQIKDDIKQLTPGLRVDYEAEPGTPRPELMNFSSALAVADLAQYFDEAVEQATGLTRNLTGAINQEGKTATEIEYSQMGSGIRFSFMTDYIKRNFNIPFVEKIADLKAIYEQEPIEILVRKGDEDKPVVIDNVVRQGKYKYSIIDSKTANQAKAQMKDFLMGAAQFAQAGVANLSELYKYWLENQGVKDAEKFINKNSIDDFISQVSEQVPDQQKPQIKQMLEDIALQAMQQIVQQQGGMANEQAPMV